jgi:hypothetical protein
VNAVPADVCERIARLIAPELRAWHERKANEVEHDHDDESRETK